MKKFILIFLFGFIMAQASEYMACVISDKYLYPHCKELQNPQYAVCMTQSSFARTVTDVLDFNFVYFGRKLIKGY